MTSLSVRRNPGPVTIAMATIASVAAVLVFAATTAAFFFAAESARYAAGEVVMPVDFLGLPLFEGFRSAGRLGVHAEWGVPVMALMFVAAVATLTVLRRRDRHRRPSRSDRATR